MLIVKMNKIILTCFVIGTIGQLVAAAGFIDLSDKNQATLGLELSKSVKGIQEAISNNFAFSTVAQVSKFLNHCQYARASVNSVDDSEFGGMAKQVKLLLAEPKITQASQVMPSEVDKFRTLETYVEPEKCEYMTKKNLRGLIAMEAEINSREGLKVVLGHLLNSATSGLGQALLDGASLDVEILSGEELPKRGAFDFEYRYKSGCALSLYAPICKLVRETHHTDIDALGQEVADFIEVLATDEASIGDYESKSGVQVGQVKELCKSIRKVAGVVGQIDAFKAAGYITEEQVSAKLADDKSLDLYYHVNILCNYLLPGSQF